MPTEAELLFVASTLARAHRRLGFVFWLAEDAAEKTYDAKLEPLDDETHSITVKSRGFVSLTPQPPPPTN